MMTMLECSRLLLLFLLSALMICTRTTHGWIQRQQVQVVSTGTKNPASFHQGRRRTHLCWEGKDDDNEKNSNQKKNPIDFILNPYETKIPEELKDEIYKAEANTEAAKERSNRIGLYAVLAFVGILCAFFNGFLTEIRNSGVTSDGVPAADGMELLQNAGFGWVSSNFVFQFLFLNKLGGGIALLGGAGAGLLAEAELDTRRINAEKIYEELERRRSKKVQNEARKRNRRQKQTTTARGGKKRRSGKEKKRLEALSEVVLPATAATSSKQDQQEPTTTTTPVVPASTETPPEVADNTTTATTATTKEKEEGGGLLETLKGYYDKADSMAASQALLLNKKLEDEGIIEKITDESGLKVIGREEAAKLQQQQQQQKETKKEEE